MNLNTYRSEEIGQMLRAIEPTQESIVDASTVFLKIGLEGFAKRLSEDWIHYFKRFNQREYGDKRKALIYLANDILQKCKFNSSQPKDFLEHFKPILSEAAKIVANDTQENLKDEFRNLLKLWKDRKVYTRDFVKELQSYMIQQEKLEDPTEKNVNSVLPEGLLKIPIEILDFLEAEKDMKKWIDNEHDARVKLDQILRNNDYTFKEDEAKFQLDALKKSQEYQHKYRTALLTKLSELIRQSDVEHQRFTHLLKKSTTMLEELNQ